MSSFGYRHRNYLSELGISPKQPGKSSVEQFVGGDRISISSIDGQTLIFFITNRTSMESFLFDLGPSYDRPSIFPGANTYQTYIFTEPIIRK